MYLMKLLFLILLFLFTLSIALLVTFTSVSRITKIKPIDAILNK